MVTGDGSNDSPLGGSGISLINRGSGDGSNDSPPGGSGVGLINSGSGDRAMTHLLVAGTMSKFSSSSKTVRRVAFVSLPIMTTPILHQWIAYYIAYFEILLEPWFSILVFLSNLSRA